MHLKLIAYVRVSSKTQTDNTSLESQSQAIKRFCERMDHQLIDLRQETQTASGKHKREVFDAVLTDVINGKADGIVVSKLDRFARSTLEGLQVASMLITAKKELLVVDLGFDTSTPIGKCIFSVLLAFAELERNMIAIRVEEGKKRVIEGGFYCGGRTPYGFISAGGPGQRQLIPHPIQYPIRAEIMDMHRQGISFFKIAKELNRRGIKPKFGGRWNQSTIGFIVAGAGRLNKLMLHPGDSAIVPTVKAHKIDTPLLHQQESSLASAH